jgi:DNA-binding MarR family transcriptional regulator
MNQADGAISSPSQQHFAFSLLHAAQAVGEKLEDALDKVGLSMAKHSALTKLAEAGEPLTLGDLASRLSCVRSNITQLVDRLESDGLVRRVDDPSDRRSVRAELTDLGREKQLAGDAELGRVQGELSALMSGADLASLEAALGVLG